MVLPAFVAGGASLVWTWFALPRRPAVGGLAAAAARRRAGRFVGVDEPPRSVVPDFDRSYCEGAGVSFSVWTLPPLACLTTVSFIPVPAVRTLPHGFAGS